MAHNITTQDKFAFTGSRKRIWHGLGEEIPEGLTATQVFPLIGLDWETELAPIFAEFGGQKIELPESRAHVRKDTGAVLGLVSDGYKPIDNGDLARFADDLLGADAAATVSTAGSLLGGKRVFTLLKLPNTIRLGKGGVDEVDTYICLSNGHGGFASFNVYPTSIRVVCNNTLTWSERDLGRGVRFHHTGDLDSKVKQARTIMGLAVKEAEHFEEQVRALAQADLSVGQVRDFMTSAYAMTFGKAPDKTAEPEAHEKWMLKRQDQVEHWMSLLENERNTLPGIQGTAWAALNAYTEWSDHERGGKWMEARPRDHRTHSNLFGAACASKKKVLRAALALTK
jgi:phage/plasmid-like protein (TIGR03299 family)